MIELDSATFQETINSEQPVFVDFWAEWCMPCKVFAPVLEELSDELDGKATFCKLNIDEHASLAQEYSIQSIPTVILFKNGEPEERIVGLRTKQQFMETVEKHLV